METDMQEQYEPEGISMQQPYSHISEGMLKEQINVQEILLDIETTLLGKELVETNNGFMLTESNKELRLINEKGCKKLMLMLRSRLNKIFQLSYFTDDHVIQMSLIFAKDVRISLFQHWDEFEIKSTSAASTITNLLHDSFFSTLQKANKGKYLQYLANVYQSTESQGHGYSMPRGEKKSTGLFEMFKLKR